jgi:ribose transport system permease protein
MDPKRLQDAPLSPARHITLRNSLGRAVDTVMHFSVVFTLLVLLIVGRSLYHPFLDITNIKNVLYQNAPLALVAVGVTYCLISGCFDLSVGSIVGLGTVVAASLAKHGLVLVLVGVMLAGLAAGGINAFVVTKLRVNTFIGTLGTQSVILGVTILYTASPILVQNNAVLDIGSDYIFGVPISAAVVIVIYAIAGFVLAKTVYGRTLYIVGGNAEAGRLAGIRTNIATASAFLVSGVCSATAGLLLVSVVGNGQGTYGSDYVLSAATIVVIGGTSLFGGEGSIWRTAVGVLLIAMTENLFNSLALPGAMQDVVIGAILIFAVAIDSHLRVRQAG